MAVIVNVKEARGTDTGKIGKGSILSKFLPIFEHILYSELSC